MRSVLSDGSGTPCSQSPTNPIVPSSEQRWSPAFRLRSTRKTLRGDLAAAVRAQTDLEFIEQQWLMKTDDFKEGVKASSERRPSGTTRIEVRAHEGSHV